MASPQSRLALFGHSGAGKSMSARIVTELCEDQGLRVERVRLAEPLYAMQHEMYRRAGRSIPFYAQDQVLLESIAGHLRRISPTALADDFERRLEASDADVALNDDLRDVRVDMYRLRRLGFVLVRIDCDDARRAARLRARGDESVVADSSTTRDIHLIDADVVVDNATDDEAVLCERIRDALKGLL